VDLLDVDVSVTRLAYLMDAGSYHWAGTWRSASDGRAVLLPLFADTLTGDVVRQQHRC
jgi:hypothetical protein